MCYLACCTPFLPSLTSASFLKVSRNRINIFHFYQHLDFFQVLLCSWGKHFLGDLFVPYSNSLPVNVVPYKRHSPYINKASSKDSKHYQPSFMTLSPAPRTIVFMDVYLGY